MVFNLKSFKTLQVFQNGCISLSSSISLKSSKKLIFFKKDLAINPSNALQTIKKHSNTFYFRYRNQIFKNPLDEFTISYTKY